MQIVCVFYYIFFQYLDECAHLATTIGQVMEEAATKCEQDMERRQSRLQETIQTLQKHIEQVHTKTISWQYLIIQFLIIKFR